MAAEDTYPTLEVGSTTFTNVTVVTRTKTHLSFTHERGFATVKLRDLSTNTLIQLGYQLAPPKPARMTLALPKEIKVDPRLTAVQQQFTQQAKTTVEKLDRRWLYAAAAGLGLLYLLFCYCCQLISVKAGGKPGVLAWIPVLQWIPLLQAAKMPAWNLVLMLLPVVGFVAYLIWCIKVCQVRQKSSWLAFFLFFPLTSAIAFLYLAFSDGLAQESDRPQKIQLAFP